MLSSLQFLDMSQRPFYLLNCIQQWLQLVLDLFTSGIAILFVGIAVSTSTATAGSVGLALLSMLTLNQSLITTIVEWTELETSLGAVTRLRSMELHTPKEEEGIEDLANPENWPQRGDVEFKNVVASYAYVIIS
jgi:ATP-binding cassette subfamily C (CFTR/MRP) protein 1